MKNGVFAFIVMTGLSAPALAETIHVGVDGLVCAFCVKGIESSFKKQDAVEKIQVKLDEKQVTVDTKDGATLDDATIERLITDAGYTMTSIHRQE